MRKMTGCLIGLLTLTIAGPAMAAGSASQEPFEFGKPYFGVKAGFIDINAPGADSAINIGGLVGAPLPNVMEGFAAEADLTTSITKANVGNTDYRFTELGGYAAYRHSFMKQLAFKVKAGVAYHTTSVSGGGSDSSFDPSLGVGLVINNQWEIEYTTYDASPFNPDSNWLGVTYRF